MYDFRVNEKELQLENVWAYDFKKYVVLKLILCNNSQLSQKMWLLLRMFLSSNEPNRKNVCLEISIKASIRKKRIRLHFQKRNRNAKRPQKVLEKSILKFCTSFLASYNLTLISSRCISKHQHHLHYKKREEESSSNKVACFPEFLLL